MAAKKSKPKAIKLTPEVIEERISYAKRLHAERIEDQDAWQSTVTLQSSSPAAQEDGVVTITLPTPFTDNENLVNALTTNEFNLEVFPANETTEEANNAEYQENLVLALLHAHEEQQGIYITHDLAWYLGATGWMVARTQYDQNAPPELSPYRVDILDPKSVYPVPGAYGWEYVCEIAKVRGSNLISLFPDTEWEMAQDYDVMQYWDRTFRAVKIADEWVLPLEAHNYGFLPYVINFGFSTPKNQIDLSGQSTASRWGVSQVFAATSLYDNLNSLLGMWHTYVLNNVNPVYTANLENPDDAKKRGLTKLAPGMIIPLGLPESMEPLKTGQAPADLPRLTEIYQNYLQRTTWPDVSNGLYPGDSAGVLVKYLLNAPRSKLSVPVQNLSWLLARVAEQILILSKKYGVPENLQLLSPKTKNGPSARVAFDESRIYDFPRVKVTIRPHFNEDDAQNAAVAKMWADMGVPLQRLLTEYKGTQDVEAMRREWLAEQAYKDPDLLKAAMIQEIQKRDPALAALYMQTKGGVTIPQIAPPAGGEPPAGYTENPNPTGMPPGVMPPEVMGMTENMPQNQTAVSPQSLGGL